VRYHQLINPAKSMKSIENKKLSYLANTNFLLGLFVAGPVGLHLIAYISYGKKKHYLDF